MSKPTPHNPKVFISYSHDSSHHLTQVLNLSNRLREDGIDSHLDQYEVSPPEGWARWTLREVEDADFVIVVCTAVYRQRFLGEDDKGKGRGVIWEGAVISQNLYEQAVQNTKFVPVLFSDADSANVPLPLRSTTFYDLSQEEGYEDLYRRLTNQPLVLMGELGKLKPMPPASGKQLFAISARDSSPALSETPPVAHNDAVVSTVDAADKQITKRWSRVAGLVAVLFLLAILGVFGLKWIKSKSVAPRLTLQKKVTTPGPVYDIVVSKDGSVAASADGDGAVYIWNVSQGSAKKLNQLSDSAAPHRLAISPGSELLSSGNVNGSVSFWLLPEGRPLESLKVHAGLVFWIDFSPDGEKLLSAGKESDNRKSICWLDVVDRETRPQMVSLAATERLIAISPDLQMVAVSSGQNRAGQLRSLSNDKRTTELEGPDLDFGGGVFSPDSQVLAAGSEAGLIRLWRVRDGKLLGDLKGPKNWVESVSFHPNGQIIAAGYADGTLCLWRVSAPDPFTVVKAHDDRVNAIAFSANGQMLATASADKSIQFWTIDPSN